MEFRQANMNIKLQGVRTPTEPALTEMHADQLYKWIQGNEVWALAVIQHEQKSESSDDSRPPQLQALLEEFADFFQ